MIYDLNFGKNKMQVDRRGAYVRTLSLDGLDIFFPRREIDYGGKMKFRGGMHPCLPNFGPGGDSGLKQHGFARDMTWEVVDMDDNSIDLHLQLLVGDYENLVSSLRYSVFKDSFQVVLKLKNVGEEKLAVSPGFHPYFNIKNTDTIKINGKQVDPAKQEFKHTIFEENIGLLETDQYILEFQTEDLNKFAIWTDLRDDYLCIEPTYNWNSFQEKTQVIELEKGEERQFRYTIHMEKK